MAHIKNLVISTSRKLSQNYNTREAGFTVTLELAENENPRDVLNAWTERLQKACDRAVGDPQGISSFAHTTGYQPPFPVQENG